jgi:hypothetical protein
MDYMFLLYHDESRTMSPEERARSRSRQWSIIDDSKKKGVLRSVSPLEPTTTAVSFRAKDGQLVATDGPFAETKEALGGYYIIDCADVEEAKYWASRMAQTGCANTIEMRLLRAIPDRVDVDEAVAVNA